MLRNSLKNDPPEKALAVWSNAFDVNKLGVDWIKHLMDVTRKGMGLPSANPVKTQERLLNALIRPKNNIKEKMLPKSAFAGSNKHKLGPSAHLKGSMKRPAKAGDLVGDAE